MAFESLSARFDLELSSFPPHWVPLTHLYDPDLPLFPLLYFHVLDPSLPSGSRPSERDRIYGFIQHFRVLPGDKVVVTVVANKDLNDPTHKHYVKVVQSEVASRLGIETPVTEVDIAKPLLPPLQDASSVLLELWHSIVVPAFGGKLPFGRIWDPVLGLVRFIASWNSAGGRKGELVQTHYFASAFGERIATAHGIYVDFYLLPTFEELIDTSNPLANFPKFRDLVLESAHFVKSYCKQVSIGSMSFSAFSMASAGVKGSIDTQKIRAIIGRRVGSSGRALSENYNAFNRGPARSIISLLMIDDLRAGRWDPRLLTPQVCSDMYRDLGKSYQSPKVIQLYAQQCFASEVSLPIDLWVKTFLKWPLAFGTSDTQRLALFKSSSIWGRLERLIWVAAQARKVHSSAASEILWCIRYGGPDKEMRGANPFSCKICSVNVRQACPSHKAIENKIVSFNKDGADFRVNTSAGDNSLGQTFESVRGDEIYDEYSTKDRPNSFPQFPKPNHLGGTDITVTEFIDLYH